MEKHITHFLVCGQFFVYGKNVGFITACGKSPYISSTTDGIKVTCKKCLESIRRSKFTKLKPKQYKSIIY